MTPPDDWAVVEEALPRDLGNGYTGFATKKQVAEGRAALARLREREAQLERHDQAATQDAVFFRKRMVRLEEALRELTGKRITDAEGWATWAKNVARRALAHEEEAP